MDNLITTVIGCLALVLVVARLAGAAARRCGQPTVVGHILAGVLLGPSLLGRLPGHLTSHLFPASVLPSLTALAQVAIVIFMFVVGYELDWRSLRGRRRAGSLVALCALLVPMTLGSGSALVFRSGFAALGQAHVSRSYILFMGVAMSITALPVLAAITRELGISSTVAGVTATTAAGIMDVAAWLVLAVALVGTAHKADRPWPVTLLLVCCFVAFMLLVVRRVLRWWLSSRRFLLAGLLPLALTLTLASAWVTASLGLHPVFGGFLAGLAMRAPDQAPDADVLRPMEEVAGLFMPLFFVITGLSMNVGSLPGIAFILLAVVCAIASGGKLGPAYAASRVGGLDRHDAATVAVLVNTRGLTELIALNVGLSAGIISHQLFTVLVLMALITTIATAPMLRLIGRGARSRQAPGGVPAGEPDGAKSLAEPRHGD
jgi:Kef-type K+ transport system membrane component KefB